MPVHVLDPGDGTGTISLFQISKQKFGFLNLRDTCYIYLCVFNFHFLYAGKEGGGQLLDHPLDTPHLRLNKVLVCSQKR